MRQRAFGVLGTLAMSLLLLCGLVATEPADHALPLGPDSNGVPSLVAVSPVAAVSATGSARSQLRWSVSRTATPLPFAVGAEMAHGPSDSGRRWLTPGSVRPQTASVWAGSRWGRAPPDRGGRR
jgi:hypothetical protein